MSTYSAVLSSLTPTEKVRRIVMLLAGVSFLLLNFEIDTNGVTFLGARIPREVLYFAIFHALVFYVVALTFHGILRGADLSQRINDAAAERAQILAGLEDSDPRVQSRIVDLVEGARASLAGLRHRRDAQVAEARRLEAVLRTMHPMTSEYRTRELDFQQAQRFCTQLESELAEQTAIAEGTTNILHRAKSSLQNEARRTGRPPGLAIFYVLTGEWLLPIAFGVICAAQLAGTHYFTPVWQAVR
ncbi:hypothetical protein [Terricaulis sp.]|uniref:hypothetical protein n=1 Tax=Terricaulis sp. TaxID=2768686 RepID=UPI0037843C1F